MSELYLTCADVSLEPSTLTAEGVGVLNKPLPVADKAGVAFRHVLLGCYTWRQSETSVASIVQLVEAHWVELEKKGLLPKGK